MIKIIIFITLMGEGTPLPTSTSITTILYSDNEIIRIDKTDSEEGKLEIYTYMNLDKNYSLMLHDDEIKKMPLMKTGGWVAVPHLDTTPTEETYEIIDSKLHHKKSYGMLQIEKIYFEIKDDSKTYEYLPFLNHEGKWYMFETTKHLMRDFVTTSINLEKFEDANVEEIELFEEIKKKFGDQVD